MRKMLWAVADISVSVIAVAAVGFTGYIIYSIIKGVCV